MIHLPIASAEDWLNYYILIKLLYFVKTCSYVERNIVLSWISWQASLMLEGYFHVMISIQYSPFDHYLLYIVLSIFNFLPNSLSFSFLLFSLAVEEVYRQSWALSVLLNFFINKIWFQK